MKKRLLPFVFLFVGSCAVSGQAWSPKAKGALPANFNVSCLSIVNDQVIWAAAADWSVVNAPVPLSHVPKILKSTDGGETWQVQDMQAAAGTIVFDLHAMDENTAFATTNCQQGPAGNGLFRTTDGGATWTEVVSGDAGGVFLHFFDQQTGICWYGRNMRRTINGGQSWQAVPLSNIPALLTNEGILIQSGPTGFAAFGDTLWVGTTKGRVFRSANRGLNWKVFSAGLPNGAVFTSMAFTDSRHGIALYYFDSQPDLYLLAHSSDGGEHWANVPDNSNFTEVAAIPCGKAFIGTAFHKGFKTAVSYDYGQSWTLQDTVLLASVPVFASPGHGWMAPASATGAEPALYKWSGEALYGRTYVNQNATGANNGQGWADAYTDLQTALAAAQAGDEIWVVEGTYKPAAPGGSQTATFLMDKNLKLYGGFAGTECNLSERNIALRRTVLSGDLNGDDVDSSFTQNRADNVLHVVRISTGVTAAATFDGFTVRGGQADGTSIADREGGGMTCSGSPLIRNCVFEQNFATRVGGGARLSDIASPGLLVENCRFERNEANVAGGLAIIAAQNFTLAGCTFSHNRAVSGILQAAGGGLHISRSNGQVNRCAFLGNYCALYGGGLLIIDFTGAPGNNQVEITDCLFEGNSSDNNDGGLSLNSWVANNRYTVRRCVFKQNNAANYAGGLGFYAQGSSNNAQMLVDSCIFSQNHTDNNGGAVFTLAGGKNMSLDFNRCHFTENTAVWECGAADFWSTNGGTGTLTVDSCLFEKNTAFWAGALEMGSGHGNIVTQVNYFLTNSVVQTNHATDQAGGILLWSDQKATANFHVENCLIQGNSSEGKGGGIAFAPTSTDYHATISRTRIVGNQSTGSGGAALIDYEIFENVPFPANASVLFENCLIAGNTSAGAGITADSLPNLKFLNCTIADNQSNGIQLSDQSGLTLQNTILHNPGFTEYTAATSNVSVTSHGGNLIGDGSLAGHALSYDLQNTDPVFAGAGDYHLANNSPAIDKGVDTGNLPSTDLDGNARINGCVDIGAYESAVVVSTECVTGSDEVMAVALLSVSPNPVSEVLYLRLPEAGGMLTDMRVFDVQGRVVMQRAQVVAGEMLEVQGLAPGVYALKATVGEQVYAGRFLKL